MTEKKKVYIDGHQGTTGLRIYERLAERSDLDLITLPEEKRKDLASRKKALNAADLVFLCLPDEAAREAVTLIDNPDVVVFDTSTAHRTDKDWVYGLPELSCDQENAVKNAKRIAVPGCHAAGFILLVYPLISAGLLKQDVLLSCFSLTGYSGGGKSMIAQYEDERTDKTDPLQSPRQYALGQEHKHLKEIVGVTGLKHAPVFCPIVADFYSGMEVTVPLFKRDLMKNAGIDDIRALYREYYRGPVVSYKETLDSKGFIAANTLTGKDSLEITVTGNEQRLLLIALYDNLGKGASGAALECMNISLGIDKEYQLVL
jgi:N-acetyl-gamma-glutamyl-phosphate reductase